MKKRHFFHCQKCNSECQIYRKGKKHKVLICPKCGILASNPSGIGATIGGALGTAILPGVGTVAGGYLGDLLEGEIFKEKPQKPASSAQSGAVTPQRAYRPRESSGDKLLKMLQAEKQIR